MELKSNSQIELAHEFLRSTGVNIFLTGRAGTGKTTFLRTAIERLNKRVVVAAPTGVAAINAGGVTLHSLFQLPFTVHLPGVATSQSGENRAFRFRMSKRKIALIRSIELLVIDEISMVRCDLLDAIDETLRRVRRDGRAFGGVQLLMIGDIQQLSPICPDTEWDLLREHYQTPYFFDSRALKECDYVTIELNEIFRQSDPHFTSLLNAVRDNAMTTDVIETLNSRYIPNFNPPQSEGYITLSTHNNSANSINTRKLNELCGESKIYTATIKGDYPQSAYPNDTELELKVGAQVIFIKNDISPDKLYYNGLIGEITSFTTTDVTVQPNSGGDPITVSGVAWENIEYSLDSESGEIREDIKGSFTQLPLRCAWAITIHKSQGLSFDRAIIDAGSSFAHGQVYVALSRCRTLEGMVLSTPLGGGAIIKDRSVETFTQQVGESQPSESDLERHKRAYLCSTLCEVFGFGRLYGCVNSVVKLLSGHLYLIYPQLCNELAQQSRIINNEAVKYGESFQRQIVQIISTEQSSVQGDDLLRERVCRAAEYFTPRITPLLPLIAEVADVEPDAAELKKRIGEAYNALNEELTVKVSALKLCEKGFSVERYQQIKVESIAQGIKEKPKRKESRKIEKDSEKKSLDIIHPKLYETLRNWRRSEAEDREVSSYMILSNRSLVEIQEQLPTSEAQLKKINGVGIVKIKQFGEEILTIVKDYCYDNDL
ncbi:MAG: HRDC domain-containing protein [Rikenellaceae bacterium]